jgi:hypothetical protein
MAVFDRVAMNIKNVLGESDVKLYPSNPVAAPEAKTEIASEEENQKEVF